MSGPLQPGIYTVDPDNPECPFCKIALVAATDVAGWHDCPTCEFSANFTDLDAKQATR